MLLIACGALCRAIVALMKADRLAPLFDVQLSAAGDLAQHALAHPGRGRQGHSICQGSLWVDFRSLWRLGTGGLLDKVLAEEGVERIDGPHCYAFLSGNERFAATAEEDVTTFFSPTIWRGISTS